MQGFDRKAMAARLAQDIPEGWIVNLGIGIPTMVGMPMPRLTIQPSGMSCARRAAMALRSKPCMCASCLPVA